MGKSNNQPNITKVEMQMTASAAINPTQSALLCVFTYESFL